MTNSPKYDWQVTNLRNYVNLSPINPNPIKTDKFTFNSTGQGAGAVGLPGDASPPSRFVKTSFMVNYVYPSQTSTDLINTAQHVINNVDLPAGYVRSIENGQTSTDITQWVVFKDVTHKTFYYRTYNDMTLRQIAMAKIDFTKTAPRLIMPLSTTPYVLDMTNQFMAVKQ
jgi:choloylglycine hydrolase